MSYNSAMLSGPRMERRKRLNYEAMERKRAAQMVSPNRGVQTFVRTVPGWRTPTPLSVTQYYNAGVLTAYGQTDQARLQLGDLFNDVMGAVVPGWAARPDWMKKIVVKPDPQKLMSAAQKVAPNAAGQIVGAAEKAGINLFVNTPGGQIPLTPGMAQGLYANAPWLVGAKETLSVIPSWVWIAGAGGILLLVVSMRK